MVLASKVVGLGLDIEGSGLGLALEHSVLEHILASVIPSPNLL